MVSRPQTKPNPPSVFAGLARNLVGNGKPRSEAGSPALNSLYQPLPAATVKYTEMKTSMKVMAVAVALSSAALALHYLIGSMSY